MSKCVKRMMLDTFGGVLKRNHDFIVVDSSKVIGLDVNRIRLDFVDIKLRLLGVKNAIAAKALEEFGVKGSEGIFIGPTSIVFGDVDIVELSKRVVKCAESNKSMVIRGAVIDGCVVDGAAVSELSRSPGRIELLSNLSALILSPGASASLAMLSSGQLLTGQIAQVGSRVE